MVYSAVISRNHLTYFLFLLDQSHSMADPFGAHHGKSRAEEVADAINRLLANLFNADMVSVIRFLIGTRVTTPFGPAE
jgi:hypothetical protein